MTDEINQEGITKIDEKPAKESKPRQVIIETDGNSVNLVKAEVSGSLELVAILQALINFINKK